MGLGKGLLRLLGQLVYIMLRSIQAHPYHLVEPSPWPLSVAFALLTTTLSGVMCFHGYSNGPLLLALGIIATVSSMALWLKDVSREGTFQGHHTLQVRRGLQLGFLLFIVSEFFLGFLPFIFSPNCRVRVHVTTRSSGATLTYSHHCLIAGTRKGTIFGLFITIFLAAIFTALQAYEYYNASFTISDGVYGSTFYMTTGLHGIHVIIGTAFLIVCLFRILSYHLTNHHHEGSVDLARRLHQHLYGGSSNILLQNALLKYSLSAFTFSILCFCSREQLLTLEQLAIELRVQTFPRDASKNCKAGRHHTLAVRSGLTLGFILFVISEVFFFLSIFWAFFHSALAPTVELGSIWPPAGIETMNPFEIPLLNTVILLSSVFLVFAGRRSLPPAKTKKSDFNILSPQLDRWL
ncbi:cytochrome c oxidase subunit III domain-containing protein [Jimgerdemannia flammicorona]|uniref:Cytochrome c oxidase subunit 3 n=1 Tax=Jimgerdemannia flammicorona TaxID=994334 RepID=A0A433QRU9_9FUNG|nr:cytochrome c oxidase subunit III domain-containing protein [Jimgerdemannia flammicorona]